MSPSELRLDAPRAATTRNNRRLAAMVLSGAALAVFGSDIVRMMSAMAADPVLGRALSGGMLAALATALGTVPVLFARPLSARTQSAMLGFGAGVMLAATAFSLIIPGIDAARMLWNDPWLASGVMVAGILAGGGALLWLDGRLPHEHFLNGTDARGGEALARIFHDPRQNTLHGLLAGGAPGTGQVKCHVHRRWHI